MNKKANLSSLSTQTTLTIFIGLVKKTNKSSKVPLLHVVNLEHAFLRQQDEKIVDTKWYLPNSCPCFLSTTSVVVTISTASHPHTSSEAASISLNPRTITAKTTTKNIRTTILVFTGWQVTKPLGWHNVLFCSPHRSGVHWSQRFVVMWLQQWQANSNCQEARWVRGISVRVWHSASHHRRRFDRKNWSTFLCSRGYSPGFEFLSFCS